MFDGATAWLAKFERTDGSASEAGPPSNWQLKASPSSPAAGPAPRSYTPITDANFDSAIDACLGTNPVDGMCSTSEFGAMPGWDVSLVTSMGYAFYSKSTFNADISGWNTSSVWAMYDMFNSASAFNQPLGAWNTASVTSMNRMFNFASSFDQPLEA
jgi:surface protein